MNKEMETMRNKIVIGMLALLIGIYFWIKKRKQNNLDYYFEEYDSYENSTRKKFNSLLLVVCLFQLGM